MELKNVVEIHFQDSPALIMVSEEPIVSTQPMKDVPNVATCVEKEFYGVNPGCGNLCPTNQLLFLTLHQTPSDGERGVTLPEVQI